MTPLPNLYDARLAELNTLVKDHAGKGSLDAVNGDVFDQIIEAWYVEALADLEARHVQSLHETEAREAPLRERLRDLDARIARLREERDALQAKVAQAERDLFGTDERPAATDASPTSPLTSALPGNGEGPAGPANSSSRAA